MRDPPRIHVAITSHGLGHLTRTLAVVRELLRLHPRVEAILSTTAPRPRIERDLPVPFRLRAQAFEPGAVQTDCFHVDVERTRAAYRHLFRDREGQLETEKQFLRDSRCRGVLSDIPALPIRAASALGLPSAGVASFTWDWLLEPILEGPECGEILEQLREEYRCGELHLRLPLGPASSPFQRLEDAPLVSRQAVLPPGRVRAALGLPPCSSDGRALVLVCPGGWTSEGWDPIHVRGCGGCRFLMVGGLPVTAEAPCLHLPHDLPRGIGLPDLVGAADLVLAKPGYGIASECVVHRTPLVAIERTGFRETPLLLREIKRIGRVSEITLSDFFAGRWQRSLEQAMEIRTPWHLPPPDAATRVAKRLGSFFGLERDRRL